MSRPILELRGVSKRFDRPLDTTEKIANLFGAGLRAQSARAVEEVSLSLNEREVVGLVGESGCGKSTVARMAAGILRPTSGEVAFRGRAIDTLRGRERHAADLAVQMVFQDPSASLNPRMRVREILAEGPVVHGLVPKREADAFVERAMLTVGLDPSTALRYPHQFSGGQRARIGIARALSLRPDVIVCDEATAALDVSIQAQVINLFLELRQEMELSYLFVSHDLGVIRHLADHVAVMYLGRIVELAPTGTLFELPLHPYSQALLAEVPRLDARRRRFSAIKGEIPSPLNPPPGCHFHPRCPAAFDRCKVERPALRDLGAGRSAACHLLEAASAQAGAAAVEAAS